MGMTADSASVRQASVRGELGRRVRIQPAANGDVHVIVEAQDFSGDDDYSDELGRATVLTGGLRMAVDWACQEIEDRDA
jgi:hypothetical protein